MKTVPDKLTISGICLAAMWILPAAAGDMTGAAPGDDAMTCPQIGAELAPYAQQMAAAFNPLAQTQQQLMARSQARVAEYTPAMEAMTAAALASSADPTGLSSRALGQAQDAMQREVWNRAMTEDKPLADQANRQANQAIAQAMPMQANPRIQRLMQLARQKNCH